MPVKVLELHHVGFGVNHAQADAMLDFYRDVLSLPQLAIVGSRNPTQAGYDSRWEFAAQLARSGLVITSGLAIGIDAAAHRGALEGGGRTIAVCGTGLDIDYPRANAGLSEEIASGGALLSEFPLGTPASKSNFPRRNRIISGLSLGTLVVEAAVRSGSLITARLAGEQGREVFAIPGSIRNPLARGCHKLIRDGAQLVEIGLMREQFARADILVTVGDAEPDAPAAIGFRIALGQIALAGDEAGAELGRTRVGIGKAIGGLHGSDAHFLVAVAQAHLGAQFVEAEALEEVGLLLPPSSRSQRRLVSRPG